MSCDVEHEPEKMYTVYHVTSLNDLALSRATEDGVEGETVTCDCTRFLGRSLAERQLNRPRALSS